MALDAIFKDGYYQNHQNLNDLWETQAVSALEFQPTEVTGIEESKEGFPGPTILTWVLHSRSDYLLLESLGPDPDSST